MAKKNEKKIEEVEKLNSEDSSNQTIAQTSAEQVARAAIEAVISSFSVSDEEVELKVNQQKIEQDNSSRAPLGSIPSLPLTEEVGKQTINNPVERRTLSHLNCEQTYNVTVDIPSLNDRLQECEFLSRGITDFGKVVGKTVQDKHFKMTSPDKKIDSCEETPEISPEKTGGKLNESSLAREGTSESLTLPEIQITYCAGKKSNSKMLLELDKFKAAVEKDLLLSEESFTANKDQVEQSFSNQSIVFKELNPSLDETHSPELENQQNIKGPIERNTYSGLQWLPDQLLDSVLGWLSFADVSRVGGTCRRLRRVAAAALRREMRSLVARVETAMAALEEETAAQAQGGACMVPVVMRIILHTVLRVLLGEARVLRAVCWRYVRMDDLIIECATGSPGQQSGPSPVVCFPGGDILDEFERLLDLVCVDNFGNDIDPEVVTGLFMRMEKFLDYFEGSIETLLPCGETPFGVKVVDLLGACDTADCAVSVTHGTSDRPFLVTVNFELRDASAVDSPPPFDGQMPSHMRLRLLGKYLRNNVRWVNFFRPMRELWDLQDEIENRWAPSSTGEHRDISRHHTLHQVVMDALKAKIFRRNIGMPPPRPSPSHLPPKQTRQREMYEQVVLRAEPPLWRETFSRRINPAVRALRLGLSCNLELSGGNKSMLPLDFEFLDEERVDSATRHPGLSPQSSLVRSQVAGGTSAESIASASATVVDLTAPAAAAGADEVTDATPAAPTAPVEDVSDIAATTSATDTTAAANATDTPGPGSAEQPVPPPLPQPAPQRLPPLLAHGEIPLDWGPWLRLRRNYHSTEAKNGRPTDGWDDYGANLRSGGAYGFRGEVRVTFPPRALSSIVTETVIQVNDTGAETIITSDRRWFFYL